MFVCVRSSGERHRVLAFHGLQGSGSVKLNNMRVLPEEVVKSDSSQHWGAAELPERNTYKNTHTHMHMVKLQRNQDEHNSSTKQKKKEWIWEWEHLFMWLIQLQDGASHLSPTPITCDQTSWSLEWECSSTLNDLSVAQTSARTYVPSVGKCSHTSNWKEV